jgi:hypothetical protein
MATWRMMFYRWLGRPVRKTKPADAGDALNWPLALMSGSFFGPWSAAAKADILSMPTNWLIHLNRNPVSSMPGRCLGCGGGDHSRDPLLPYGIEKTGHVWLHGRCWLSWHEGRKAEAVAVLTLMGLPARVGRLIRRRLDHDGADHG